MKTKSFAAGTLVAALVAFPLLSGCASRTAPFNKMDDASMTILKLQQPAPANPLATQPGQLPMIPIPGLTAEQQQQLQQSAQQLGQGLQQMIPGLPAIPGLTTGGAPAQTQPQQQLYNGYAIAGQGYGDKDTQDDLLDLFGDKDNFTSVPSQCFTPGMAVIFQPPDGSPTVEVMVSLSCNQVAGNQWPYQERSLSPEAANKLRSIYFKVFQQPPPPSGA